MVKPLYEQREDALKLLTREVLVQAGAHGDA